MASCVILAACGSGSGSDADSDSINLAPKVELIAPSSALSLEQVVITAQVSDPENDKVSLTWTLTSTDGISSTAIDVTELKVAIPFTQVETSYTATLVAKDTQGNSTTASKTFTVAPLSVSFDMPFGAVSQRYVDVEAKLTNIASDNLKYEWTVNSGSDYPLTAADTHRLRFYAAKQLTEGYSADLLEEYRSGEGVNEEMRLSLTLSQGEESLTLTHGLTIAPIEQAPEWPLHEIVAKPAQASTPKYANWVSTQPKTESEDCLTQNDASKKSFDFNLDGHVDSFCMYKTNDSSDGILYFYLSEVNSAGEVTYSKAELNDDFIVPELDGAALVYSSPDDVPTLVLLGAERLEDSNNFYNYNNFLVSFSFDASSLSMVKTRHSRLDYIPERIDDYIIIEKNGVLALVVMEIYGLSSGGKGNTYYFKSLIFDYSQANMLVTHTKELDHFGYMIGYGDSSLKAALFTDIDGEQGDELLVLTHETDQSRYFDGFDKVYILSQDFSVVSRLGHDMDYVSLVFEDVDLDPYPDLIGSKIHLGIFVDEIYDGPKVMLTLGNDGDIKETVINNGQDTLFDFTGNGSTSVDNDNVESIALKRYYHPKVGKVQCIYSLFASNRSLVVARSSSLLMSDWRGNKKFDVTIVDMDNDADLDIRFTSKHDNGTSYWLQNVSGYPL